MKEASAAPAPAWGVVVEGMLHELLDADTVEVPAVVQVVLGAVVPLFPFGQLRCHYGNEPTGRASLALETVTDVKAVTPVFVLQGP